MLTTLVTEMQGLSGRRVSERLGPPLAWTGLVKRSTALLRPLSASRKVSSGDWAAGNGARRTTFLSWWLAWASVVLMSTV